MGAVALKNSVYLLPATAETEERFQWLTQEIQKDGGDATLIHTDRIENMEHAELVRLFQVARGEDYRQLAERYRRLLREAGPKPGRAGAGRRNDELRRLAVEFQRLKDIDFFDAPGGAEVARLRESVEQRLQPTPAAVEPSFTTVPVESLRGRRWVTRPRPHVDRIASAWLIKRFIDPAAGFLFAPVEKFPADAIPFDAVGVEFGHHGDDCTFETLLKRTGLRDRRLAELAEIVHEADLRDGKFPREEARGVDLSIRGLLAVFGDDHEVLEHGRVLFDGLYAGLAGRG